MSKYNLVIINIITIHYSVYSYNYECTKLKIIITFLLLYLYF
jgi:hypothetical protein